MKTSIRVLLFVVWLSSIFCSPSIGQSTLTAQFTVKDVCEGDTSFFINTSVVPDSLFPVDYLWKFGDGSYSTDSNAFHKFLLESSGTTQSYNVQLNVVSRNNPKFADSYAITTIINAGSDASFGYESRGRDLQIVNQVTTDPTNQYFWNLADVYFSNQVTPTFTDINIDTILNPNISLKIINNATCESSYSLEIRGIDIGMQQNHVNEIGFYPNPANSELHIPDQIESIQIFQVNGKEVMSLNKPGQTVKLDLPPGYYFVVIKNYERMITQKLLIH